MSELVKNAKADREANTIRMIYQQKKEGKSLSDIASSMELPIASIVGYCYRYHIDDTGYQLPADARIKEFDSINSDVGMVAQPVTKAKESMRNSSPVSNTNEEADAMRVMMTRILQSTQNEPTQMIGQETIVEPEYDQNQPVSGTEVIDHNLENADDISAGNGNELPMQQLAEDILNDLYDVESNSQLSNVILEDESQSETACNSPDMYADDFAPSYQDVNIADSVICAEQNDVKQSEDESGHESDQANIQRFYLVDTENQGCAAIKKVLQVPDPSRKILLFYTNYSQHLDFQTIRLIAEQADSMEFLECRYGIKNALDFQLISYLGFLINQFPSATFTVVSNDGGFDPAIEFWKDRHFKVSRIGIRMAVNSSYRTPAYSNQTRKIPKPLSTTDWIDQASLHIVPEQQQVKPQVSTTPTNKVPVTVTSLKSEKSEKIARQSIAHRIEPVTQLRKIGSFCTKYTPKQYRRVTQIAASELGGLFKKHKIKTTKTSSIAEYMVCHPDFTLSELAQLSDAVTATSIINNISQAEINSLLTRVDCRK